VDTYITNGVNWLVVRQKADGGFADDLAATVGTPYETALAYIALNEAKKAGNAAAVAAQTVMDNAQNFLIAQQHTDGNWSNDPLTTALALQTLPTTTLADSDNDGIPDVIESLLLTDPAFADGRKLLVKGNGDSVTGINSSVLLATTPVNRTFSIPLTVTGGTSPYHWSLVSGSLPIGLLMGDSTGIISGTPTTTGTFSFFYKVSDSSNPTNLSTSTVSQIVVKPLPVLARNPAISYSDTIQSAYDTQPDYASATIQTTQDLLNENLTFNKNITVLLQGSYDDTFTTRKGETALRGSLIISGGKVIADGFTIR
jgi:hypothetical protein